MAVKRKGNGQVGDKVATIVSAIREEIGALRRDLNARLDQIIENTGAHWREHEARLAAHEARWR